ncbi:FtsX-like permease family protein [Candidatus Bathyarchaeota archaeon]|nr:MAG: FtsX-like permease family protein [Candidatus Bathyarchaeota archaeon]
MELRYPITRGGPGVTIKGFTKPLLIVSFLALILVLIVLPIGVRGAAGKGIISGLILDEDGKPLKNAYIGLIGPYGAVLETRTDSSGRFRIAVVMWRWYLYIMYDDPNTPGMDYVPAQWSTYVTQGSEVSFTLRLEKGASLFLDGEIWFVESSKPVNFYRFTVVDLEKKPHSDNSIMTYGSGTNLVRYFGMDEREVVVPADTKVIVRLHASITSIRISHAFYIKGDAGFFKLSQGEAVHIDIRKDALIYNINLMKTNVNSALSLLRDAEEAGFLVTAERQDIMEAYSDVDASLLQMKRMQYDEAFTNLRTAYILTSRSIERLSSLLSVSSQTAILLLFFFVFVASSAAYLITERHNTLEIMSGDRKIIGISINLILAVVFYFLLVLAFYFAFPGCRLVPRETFAITAILAIFLGQAIVSILPRVFAEKKSEQRYIQLRSAIIAAFSMACRNLRRRRMRTALTIVNMMILVFGFISFTSISPGYGLVTKPLHPALPVDAILIKDKPPSEAPFNPLPESFLRWLENQPNVTLVSPKAENMPAVRYNPLDYLYTSEGGKIWVQGIIGIKPSVECLFTQINSTIVEGEFLKDGDLKGVLISVTFKETLNLKVGDSLYGFGQEFIIRGFFDPRALETLTDVNGQTLMPYYVVPVAGDYAKCLGEETIIVTYERALTLPRVVISRINVQLREGDDYSRFAEIIALTREYLTFISHPNSLTMKYVGGYVEEKGLGLVPILIILVTLNIMASIFASVRERRSEIASLSSVGLNPTHIAALFMAEAMVLGFVGGGLGYLLGLFGYRVAASPLFGTLTVREKVSAEWSLISLLLSGFTAVLASVVPAMKASTIVTPSLLRRWHISIDVKPRKAGQPWVIDLPVKLRRRELEPFIGFMKKRMMEKTGSSLEYITDIRLTEEETEKGPLIKLAFRMVFSQERGYWSENTLIISRAEGQNYFDAKIVCVPVRDLRMPVIRTVSYVRQLIFEWDTLTFEVATPYDPAISQLYTLINAYTPTTLYIITSSLEPDPYFEDKLESLRRRLEWEGIRPPRFVLSRMNPRDINQCLKVAEEIVKKVDVVCVSGKPEAISSALSIAASRQNKMMCYVVDNRPEEARLRNPFQTLKIVNV